MLFILGDSTVNQLVAGILAFLAFLTPFELMEDSTSV